MSKKKRRQNRERKEREWRKRWLPDFKTVKAFLRKNWLTITAIILPVTAAFVVYYLTGLEPDIRYIRDPNAVVEVLDDKQEGNKLTSYYRAALRFTNLSIKSGYVDRVEFTPISLGSASIVKVIDVDKVRIGWREEKVIYIKWVVTHDFRENRTDEDKGLDLMTYEQRVYDNTGKQIPDMSGNFKEIMKTGIRGEDFSMPQPKASVRQFEPTK